MDARMNASQDHEKMTSLTFLVVDPLAIKVPPGTPVPPGTLEPLPISIVYGRTPIEVVDQMRRGSVRAVPSHSLWMMEVSRNVANMLGEPVRWYDVAIFLQDLEAAKLILRLE